MKEAEEVAKDTGTRKRRYTERYTRCTQTTASFCSIIDRYTKSLTVDIICSPDDVEFTVFSQTISFLIIL